MEIYRRIVAEIKAQTSINHYDIFDYEFSPDKRNLQFRLHHC
jgi:hypothetical protein